jgi:ketosteroid isomerase-like protein
MSVSTTAAAPSASSASPVSTAIAVLCAAGEAGDADAIAEILAPDVVFHSPMTDRIRFEGKDQVAALHRDIFAVLDDIVTSEPLALGETGSFSFRARVRGEQLNAVNLVRCNEQGQIVDIKVTSARCPDSPPYSRRSRRGFQLGVADARWARSWRSSPGLSRLGCAWLTA